MSKKIKLVLGVIAAVLIAAEPLMMLWQPILPPGSYAAIATLVACVRAGIAFYVQADKGGECNDGFH